VRLETAEVGVIRLHALWNVRAETPDISLLVLEGMKTAISIGIIRDALDDDMSWITAHFHMAEMGADLAFVW